MYVINLFGAPGSGKSTLAAALFNKMKTEDYNVEYVTEFAKDLVYEDNMTALNNQLYVSGTQDHRMRRLIGKVDYLITDSPLLLGILYAKGVFGNYEFEELILKIFKSYNNLNYYITRNHKYSENGRIETENQSDEIDKRIINLTAFHNIQLKHVKDQDEIYNDLKNKKVL